jgi:hypothetical protein
MYLKQMGQVPLLTREQEVEISKRIEDAELKVQEIVYRMGFVARAHLDLAQKLLDQRERFDRVIMDKKIESRERYMKALPRLCATIKTQAQKIDRHLRPTPSLKKPSPRPGSRASRSSLAGLRAHYPKFFFKQKITDDFRAGRRGHPQDPPATHRRAFPPSLARQTQRRSGQEGPRPRDPHPRIEPPRMDDARRLRPRPRWSRPTCAS